MPMLVAGSMDIAPGVWGCVAARANRRDWQAVDLVVSEAGAATAAGSASRWGAATRHSARTADRGACANPRVARTTAVCPYSAISGCRLAAGFGAVPAPTAARNLAPHF